MAASDDVHVDGSPSLRLSSAGAHLAAWLWLAAVHSVSVAIRLPADLALRTWLHSQGFVIAHTLAIGLTLGAVAWLWSKLPPWRARFGEPAAALLGWLALSFVLADDLSGPITRLPSALSPRAWLAALALVAAVGLLASYRLGRLFARRWLRLCALALGVAAGTINAHFYPLAYAGMHLGFALATGAYLAGALQDWSAPVRPLPRWPVAGMWVLLATVSAAGFIARPSNRTLLELSHQPVAVLMPFIAPHLTETTTPFHVPPTQREWFVDRSRMRPIAPTRGNPLPKDAIVLLIGVDSLRADVLADERHRSLLPTLFGLRDGGVWFREARSPGTSTAPALASLFASRYYSQLYWTTYTKRQPEVFPHSDPTPRFPELLSASGVHTVTVDTAGWLLNEFGIVRGFRDETSARVRGYPNAARAGEQLRAKLAEHGSGPMLAFTHFLDAHSPYSAGGKKGSPFDRYLASLAMVDEEIARWVQAVRTQGLESRTVWVIFSDHGEAFGEHGLTFHANSVYEELLRVPLLIKAPALKAKAVDVPVSLIDLGPTLLDAYGVDTPSTMMGQSLVPLLLGKRDTPSRPILAEAQLKRTLVTQGVKVIHDTRRKTWEVYDMSADPGEVDNLIERDPDGYSDLRGALAAFFSVHTFRKEGYEVPFRKW